MYDILSIARKVIEDCYSRSIGSTFKSDNAALLCFVGWFNGILFYHIYTFFYYLYPLYFVNPPLFSICCHSPLLILYYLYKDYKYSLPLTKSSASVRSFVSEQTIHFYVPFRGQAQIVNAPQTTRGSDSWGHQGIPILLSLMNPRPSN